MSSTSSALLGLACAAIHAAAPEAYAQAEQPALTRSDAVSRALGDEATPVPTDTAATTRADEMSVTLKSGQGAEVKLAMAEGATTQFEWNVAGGVVNYDLHGDGSGPSTSYQQGRGVPAHSGTFTAAFNGNHGWFWRNRGTQDVTVTLKTNGEYSTIKRVM